jgi:hypothetical protein
LLWQFLRWSLAEDIYSNIFSLLKIMYRKTTFLSILKKNKLKNEISLAKN